MTHTRLSWTPPARTENPLQGKPLHEKPLREKPLHRARRAPACGPLLVITHGWGGSPHEWHAITAQLRTLGVRVAHVDHRGWRPTPRRALLGLLGACSRLRDPQAPLLLLGHSLGAAVSITAAAHCRPDQVLALAPTRIVPGTTRAARALGPRLQVAVGAADMLTGPTGDAHHLARTAQVSAVVLAGVTHAGFLAPETDALGRRLRALESRAASRRGQRADSPHRQQQTVTAFLQDWVRQACDLPAGAGREDLARDGARV